MQGSPLMSVASTVQSVRPLTGRPRPERQELALRAHSGCALSAPHQAWDPFGSVFFRMEVGQYFFFPSISEIQLIYHVVHIRGVQNNSLVFVHI